jgi:hypothetical protein
LPQWKELDHISETIESAELAAFEAWTERLKEVQMAEGEDEDLDYAAFEKKMDELLELDRDDLDWQGVQQKLAAMEESGEVERLGTVMRSIAGEVKDICRTLLWLIPYELTLAVRTLFVEHRDLRRAQALEEKMGREKFREWYPAAAEWLEYRRGRQAWLDGRRRPKPGFQGSRSEQQ